ncbi:uncharacterized protein PODANS_1_15040 [Podospora anserina S mat+]|uniref:Podospora anserina S mat+ genomic DNA chromosome 1, supercontig 4 n=1 Tax=Podospora anserina (strain S / ATCC MYA-4624 / DSM 980 / FGSC 10383) TaxID=515849 RepID=B2AT88_PODAN|nr:uncharacterized protein PODANS_1_15040 [Podospora anserina S mat+]CAP67611.1 unnamed protein product [Podospora anserina S mat+]
MSVDGGEPESRQSVEGSLPNSNPDVRADDESAPAAVLETPQPSTNQEVDETTPMEIDSEAPSPTTAESIISGIVDSDVNDVEHPPVPLPDQISSAAQPREEVEEVEVEATGEVHVFSMPYKSPLHIFRAYRFHPEFEQTVPNGVKSLTYSSRVDVQKPLCPYELNNQQCPENCEFQHFSNIKILGKFSPSSDGLLTSELSFLSILPPPGADLLVFFLPQMTKSFWNLANQTSPANKELGSIKGSVSFFRYTRPKRLETSTLSLEASSSSAPSSLEIRARCSTWKE